ncbi:P2X purinoceptor 7 [Holothuria leucospilota]|uniref:P2X purinoceptor 7 n=1 Tax=Holothuria leucospilota TaxID=206669 RepID=A0A9Q0YQ84_HOLLE|nr:P2X purinoceptor 7 [Holothuria leucospilota]
MRGAQVAQQQEERRRMRRERIRAMVDNLDLEGMRNFLRILVERQPALFLEIWEQQPQAAGPALPEQPHWCNCSRCQEMPQLLEEVCCRGGMDSCLSMEPVEMDALVLDPGVLDLARLTLNDMFGMRENNEPNHTMRHVAYRQFTVWQYGRLGRGNRHVIPSCVVTRIRATYPSPNGQYRGYVPGRLV